MLALYHILCGVDVDPTPPRGSDSPEPRHFVYSLHRSPSLTGTPWQLGRDSEGASPPLNRLSLSTPIPLPDQLGEGRSPLQ